MPVYNAGPFLDAAVDSILKQSFSDFEFIIVNDGSTDSSYDLLKKYSDSRIRLFSQDNQGLVSTLNELLRLSGGQYIARMDPDDISHPDRLLHQINYLEANPEIGFIGSWVNIVNVDGKLTSQALYPVYDQFIREQALLNCPFAHGSVMLRSSIPIKYNSTYPHAEDFDLWYRLLKVTKAYNLPEFLYSWRKTSVGASLSNWNTQLRSAKHIRNLFLELYIQTPPTADKQFLIKEIQARGKVRIFYSRIRIIITLARRAPFLAVKLCSQLLETCFRFAR